MCFSETWVTEDELKTVTLNGFTLASYYCRNVKQHGGVCIYVKDGEEYKDMDTHGMFSDVGGEFCAVDLGKSKTVIITPHYTDPLKVG